MAEVATGKTEYIRQICRSLRPILGNKMNQVFEAYCAEDDEGKQQIEHYLELLYAKHLPASLDSSQPGLVPPSEKQAYGPYTIGSVYYAGKNLYDFGLRESEWIQHVGVFGRSGAGKTNVGFLILRQLKYKKVPFIVFDWKRNYRDLLALPEFKDVEVYTIGRNIAPFTFNPLIPPKGTNPKTWLKKLIEVIAHAYLLGNGVMYLLQQAVDSVYEEAGVYSGKIENWPTFRDVLEKARTRDARGREAGWLSSTLRALSALCFGDMDTLVFKHAILVEEAHHIYSGGRKSLTGSESVMEITFREIREFGESLIILDQHPSQISLPALGNTYCTIAMNQKHRSDINALAQCLLLDKDKDLLGTLKVGQAIVKLQGRIARPFQIKVPEFAVEKGKVTDAWIQEHMQHIAPALLPDSPVSGYSVNGSRISEPQVAPDSSQNLETAFLKDIRQYPESGVAARYARLALSVRQGQKLLEKLLEQGLIEQSRQTIKTGRLRAIRLTKKGEALLAEAK